MKEVVELSELRATVENNSETVLMDGLVTSSTMEDENPSSIGLSTNKGKQNNNNDKPVIDEICAVLPPPSLPDDTMHLILNNILDTIAPIE